MTLPIARRSQIILEEVSQKHGIPVSVIIGRTRPAKVLAARREAILRMKALGMKNGVIANVFQRDPTTILDYVNPVRSEAKKVYHAANWRKWRDARREASCPAE